MQEDKATRPGPSGSRPTASIQDWVAWHELYDNPQSSLSQRLAIVRSHLSAALDAVPGPVRLLSLCAGQGRDVLGVLPGHARRGDVTAVLVEFDAQNVVAARDQAASGGLSSTVEVREADAAMPAAYADVLPADVLLLCGIFGNVSDEDIRGTVLAAASMGRAGSTVIWTRHRRPPDLTVQIRSWFAEAGFDEVAFSRRENETLTGVGVHRLREPRDEPLAAGPLFAFR